LVKTGERRVIIARRAPVSANLRLFLFSKLVVSQMKKERGIVGRGVGLGNTFIVFIIPST
jgi:hypothetical protein